MRKITVEGVEHDLPEIGVSSEGDMVVFEIKEGEHTGAQFSMYDMQFDEQDECLLHYQLDVSDNTTVDKIKSIVDNFILSILYDQIERIKNENKTAE